MLQGWLGNNAAAAQRKASPTFHIGHQSHAHKIYEYNITYVAHRWTERSVDFVIQYESH